MSWKFSLALAALWLPASLFAADAPTVVHDEAKQGDIGANDTSADPLFKLDKPGVYSVVGTGTDALDDADSFVFEVAGEFVFDFCLIASPAEFKKLRTIDAEGKVTELAFTAGNAHNIDKLGLAPGKYHVEMYMGPAGTVGDWSLKIGVRGKDSPAPEGFCTPPVELTSAEKMKEVDWPGAISIFQGHNWGDDKKYLTAIKEARYGATGAAEWQIEEIGKEGMRAYVFIWAHEAATIPAKYKDNKTVLCYYCSDRIEPHKWAAWANTERMAYKGDPHHPAIFTMYANWGGMDAFCPTVRGRAMEYYQYHWNASRRPQMYFAYLDQYRQASIKNGDVPVIKIVEVRPEDMRKTRQTVYTCLAYGVRGYRMGGAIFDVKDRDDRGVPKRNAFGEEIYHLNTAIAAYSPIFKQTRCEAVYHVEPLPPGCAATPADSWVQLSGDSVLVGVFRNKDEQAAKEDGADYLMVANRDAFAKKTAELKIAGTKVGVQRMDKESGKWVDHPSESVDGGAKVKVELDEGGGEMLRVTRM